MKNFFLTRQLREKLLLLGFVAVAAFIWLDDVSGRVAVVWREWRRTEVDADVQKRWLAQAKPVDERQRTAIANLDPKKSYDGVRLQSEISTMARGAGLNSAEVSPPKTTRSNQLAVHAVVVTLRNVELAGLVAFYRELGRRHPYIGIDKARLDAGRTNPNLVTAVFDLSAVEVKSEEVVAK